MGQVFLARDAKLGRKVAIKLLLREDPAFVGRFIVEARATARCTHENIVTIFEVGEHQGLPFMVLEYLEGKSLSRVLETKPSVRYFTELMVPVVRALERAHEHGIVHRDLKPSNILVTDRGQVKVLDFGIARILSDQEVEVPSPADAVGGGQSLTRAGALIGTIPYMSPEQWGAAPVDHQSDLWAVGVLYWQALTGLHPGGDAAPTKLRECLRDLTTPLPSIASQDPTIPAELARIVDRCLFKRKADRYQSASDLLGDLQAFLMPKATRVSDDSSPYRGLAAFGENDAGYFFGRSNEIRTAIAQLETWPLLAVVGPSGAGKSSFVHAGLVPAVRATHGDWQIRVLRPGRTPLQQLAAVLRGTPMQRLGSAPGIGGDIGGNLVERLHDAPGLFGDLLRRDAMRNKHKVMVIVDQLEELFTLSDDEELQRTFLAALLAAADDASAPVRVVLSMRADFLDRLASHKQFLTDVSRGLFFLTAPDQDNLRETLVRPAELAGYTFEEPWILDDMMQVATSRGALPLLSFAAMHLWDARDSVRKLLTVAAYKQMGGVGGAFGRHADSVAAAIPASSQWLFRAIMTRLVTADGTRAIADHAELLSLADDRSEVERILDQLVRARLIQLHSERDQGTTVELVHEMLIAWWPELRRLLEASQPQRDFLDELRLASRQWASHGKSRDLVWRGATAQEALAVVNRHALDLSAVEKEFVSAVRAGVTRSRRINVFAFTSIFVVLGLVIAGGAIAVVRISAAEHDAQHQAAAAATEARNARRAKAALAHELDTLKEQQRALQQAEAEQRKAEDRLLEANAEVEASRGELQTRNHDLKRALARARVSAEVASRATAQLEANLTKEKERVRELEQQSKIYAKELK